MNLTEHLGTYTERNAKFGAGAEVLVPPKEEAFDMYQKTGISPIRVRYVPAQHREPRIARFPESRAWNHQQFCSEKQINESNCSKAQSRNIDPEAPLHRILSILVGIAQLESRDSGSPDSQFRIADSGPLIRNLGTTPI